MANQKPETVDCDSMLYEALRIARIPDRLALNAYKEVQEVAGLNINNRLDTLRIHSTAIRAPLDGSSVFSLACS